MDVKETTAQLSPRTLTKNATDSNSNARSISSTASSTEKNLKKSDDEVSTGQQQECCCLGFVKFIFCGYFLCKRHVNNELSSVSKDSHTEKQDVNKNKQKRQDQQVVDEATCDEKTKLLSDINDSNELACSSLDEPLTYAKLETNSDCSNNPASIENFILGNNTGVNHPLSTVQKHNATTTQPLEISKGLDKPENKEACHKPREQDPDDSRYSPEGSEFVHDKESKTLESHTVDSTTGAAPRDQSSPKPNCELNSGDMTAAIGTGQFYTLVSDVSIVLSMCAIRNSLTYILKKKTKLFFSLTPLKLLNSSFDD